MEFKELSSGYWDLHNYKLLNTKIQKQFHWRHKPIERITCTLINPFTVGPEITQAVPKGRSRYNSGKPIFMYNKLFSVSRASSQDLTIAFPYTRNLHIKLLMKDWTCHCNCQHPNKDQHNLDKLNFKFWPMEIYLQVGEVFQNLVVWYENVSKLIKQWDTKQTHDRTHNNLLSLSMTFHTIHLNMIIQMFNTESEILLKTIQDQLAVTCITNFLLPKIWKVISYLY